MASYNGYSPHGYAPSAPPLPGPTSTGGQKPSTSAAPGHNPALGYGYHPPPPQAPSYGYGDAGGRQSVFPPGTHPEVVRAFQAVDRDGSGSIDEAELQAALSSGYQRFSLRTVRLLLFLFANPATHSKIGPAEFAALWSCLGQWRAIFERFDKDRSGKVDSMELRDALLSIGYAVPSSVIQVLISKYDDGKGGRGALNFDSFVECGTIVKGLTEKFKEKDPHYTGSATLTYDDFMKMVIPFLVE